jgi:predicted 2-oxoglutarate/Fe(II)-dependent dioxygenase YbiX
MFVDSVDLSHPLFWVVDDFLSEQECADFVALIDDNATEGPAPITTAQGPRVVTTVRNNTRVMFDDEQLARLLWPRARRHVPERLMGMAAVGLNERFRCYRYTEGMYFRPHFDGAFRRNEREESLLTLLLYLDEAAAGGTRCSTISAGRSCPSPVARSSSSTVCATKAPPCARA